MTFYNGPVLSPAGVLDFTGDYGLGIYAAESTKRFNLGTRCVSEDGRVFRYGLCGADMTTMKMGVKNYNALVTELASGAVATASKGDRTVTVTFNGDFWDTAVAEDELYGGYISLYNSSAVRDQRMITGNEAIAADGGATVITLDAPLSAAIATACNCEVMANPYSDLRQINEIYSSVMGMPNVDADDGDYFWIQTWGPCRVSPVGAEIGDGQDTRHLVFAANGALRTHAVSVTGGYSEQNAGFIIERTAATTGSAAPFIMLQISV